MMWAYGGFAGLGMMLLGWLAMLLFLGAVVVFGIWLIRAASPRDEGRASPDAVEILRQRYAAGEIDEASYTQALKTLGGDPATQPWNRGG